MTLFILAFVLLSAGIAILVFAFLTAGAERKAVISRMGLLSATGGGYGPGDIGFPGAPPTLSELISEPVLGFFSIGSKGHSWAVRTPALVLLIGAVVCAMLALVLFRFGLRLPLVAVAPLTLAAAYFPPRFWLRMQQERAEAKFVDLFPDAIDIVIRMLRAGLPITAAIRVVATESPAPVNEAFRELADAVEIGKPLSDALTDMGHRVALPDVRFFCVAVSLQQGTGGNLASTLEILSDIIRKRRAMRLKAKAVTGEVRLTAGVLAAIPLFVLCAFWIMDRQYVEILTSDRRGQMILLTAAVLLFVGFGVMRQMMRSASTVK